LSGYRIAKRISGAAICVLKTFQTDAVVHIAKRFIIIVTIAVGFTGVLTFVLHGKTNLARAAVL
jgi:hypothetical protein